MTTHVVADDVLGRIARRQWELSRRVLEGSHDPDYVAAALQQIIERTFVLADKFGRYTDKLLTLQQQLELLKRYNKQYWDGKLNSLLKHYTAWASDHVQHVTDLEGFHVEFDSREETIEMWWRVYVGEQPASWRWDELRLDADHYQLLDSSVRQYEPGIHRIRIDLTANWEPEEGRTLAQVQVKATQTGKILAHGEVMSIYGLHTELFREQDGVNLPYSDLGGTRVSVPGDSRPHALYVGWSPFSRKADLHAEPVDDPDSQWSAPVLRED